MLSSVCWEQVSVSDRAKKLHGHTRPGLGGSGGSAEVRARGRVCGRSAQPGHRAAVVPADL